MLDNFQKSLSELYTSFGKSSKEVLLHTEAVEKELNKIKGHFSDSKIEYNNQLKDITTLIDKLSINNEFKLNLVKDFSKYYNNKK